MNRFFRFLGIVFLALIVGGSGIAMAETHTLYATKHAANDPGAGAKTVYFQSGIVDCNDTKYFRSGVTNGDVIQLVNVPINTIVRSIMIRPTRAAIKSGTSAVVGDGTDADGFITNSNLVLNYLKLDVASGGGASVWQISSPNQMVNGVSPFGLTTTTTSNAGAFFTSGGSPYVGRDTIDMTVYVDKTATAGVTPQFQWMIECVKLPTATN